jgi:hypothetical protein
MYYHERGRVVALVYRSYWHSLNLYPLAVYRGAAGCFVEKSEEGLSDIVLKP